MLEECKAKVWVNEQPAKARESPVQLSADQQNYAAHSCIKKFIKSLVSICYFKMYE